MFEGFSERRIEVGGGIEIFARVGGEGPPLLLLHGFPQTHFCWHKIAPRLSQGFTVVVSDLRGYGASGKPPGGPRHEAYSKRAMAADQVRLMAALGHSRFHLVGHDRGGRVAHRLALDHPGCVARLAVVDIAPTAAMYAATDRAFAEAYYHWFFLIQPFDLPERLIGAEADYYLRRTLAAWCKTDGAITDEAMAAYRTAFLSDNAIHAACEDYRAAASIDLEHDAEDAARGVRLEMPVHASWGTRGTVGRQFDVLASWQAVSRLPVVGAGIDCGHFVPEEAPDALLDSLRPFLDEGA